MLISFFTGKAFGQEEKKVQIVPLAEPVKSAEQPEKPASHPNAELNDATEIRIIDGRQVKVDSQGIQSLEAVEPEKEKEKEKKPKTE